MDALKGYSCEFIDPIPDDFYCKKCSLVARTISSCCSESFCHACITEPQKQGKPCPACGETEFICCPQKKYQKIARDLRVNCNHKRRGCGWSGPLQQLDTHLDPDQDNCQYVDTKCPLNCQQTIFKNKVEYHVTKECAKRDYVCQYCNFKATYEKVFDTHLPECKYVPLQCPNMCGVTCERDFMEDHMKICRLEEVECEFSDVGCVDRFRREDKEPHTTKNSQKHLILTASLAVQTREDFQEELQEQDNKHKAEEQKLKQKIEEQDKVIREQQQKLNEAEKKLVEQKKLIHELDGKLLWQLHQQKEEKQKLTEKMDELARKLSEIEEKQENKIKNVQVQLDQLVAEEKRQKHIEEGLEREQKEQKCKITRAHGAADQYIIANLGAEVPRVTEV